MSNTTFYLIRHSVRFKSSNIDTYKTVQDKLIQSEKIILNVIGEKRAEILSNESELQNIDVVYASNCVRTLQTAKYLLEKQNLNVNIDERFDERRAGIPNSNQYPNWFELQYKDENFKTVDGESQKEVRNRFSEAFFEILNEHRGKRIAIFSHGYAITFFLLKWCKLQDVSSDQGLKISFKDKIIIDKRINAPEVFKLIIDDNNEPIDIQLIEFDDLPFMVGT